MPDQTMHALDRANQVKLEHMELVAQIKTRRRRGGAYRAIDVIEHQAHTITFERLVRAVPQVGAITAERMLDQAGINPRARISDVRVTARKRHLLIGQLLTHAEGGRR